MLGGNAAVMWEAYVVMRVYSFDIERLPNEVPLSSEIQLPVHDQVTHGGQPALHK